MKDILVIHPLDPTTDCLCTIYQDRQDCNVIRNPLTNPSDIARALKIHSKILLLGHGTEDGLLACSGGYRFGRYIVDGSHKTLLSGKNKSVWSIWCNSDRYFNSISDKQTGIHTSMIISEISEEIAIFGRVILPAVSLKQNMKMFSEAFRYNLDFYNPIVAQKQILEMYQGDDEVTYYNRERILVF